MVVNILPGQEGLSAIKSGDTIATYSRIGADDMLSTLNVTNENAALLTSDLLKITDKILEAKGTLGVLVSDSLLAGDIKQTLHNLKQTSEQTNRAMKKINHELSQIKLEESLAGVLLNDSISRQRMEKLILNLDSASVRILEITKKVDDLVIEVKDGKGALSYLTQDEILVQNIDTTMVNIKESSKKLNENMDALRHNWLFKGYFKKLERQERKNAGN